MLQRVLADMAEIIGLAAIIAGVYLWLELPAALITGGAAAVVIANLHSTPASSGGDA